MKRYTFITPDKEEPHVYQTTTGRYIPAEAWIRTIAQDALGERTQRSHIEETLTYIKNACWRSQEELNTPPNLFLTQTGVLDVETRKVTPFTPTIFLTNALPIQYVNYADCPAIDAFLEQVVGGHKNFFYELTAYCLYRSYKIQKAFMFVGSGANGKSVTLNILRTFLGNDNVSGIELQDLAENRFAASNLRGKLANIAADLDARAIRDTGTFKELTGGDRLSAEKKFREPVPFVNYAKLVFSANKVPAARDDADAFFRRWIIVSFNKKFEGANADIHLLDKLTTPAELSGLLNKALDALPGLLERGAFSDTASTDELREAYIKASDPVSAFNMECIVDDNTAFVTKDELYAEFVEYCQTANMPAYDKAVFGKRLQATRALLDGQETVDGRRVRVWKGIKTGKVGRCLTNKDEDKPSGLGGFTYEEL